MCMKGGYASLSSNLDENYLDEGIATFIACKTYDETVTVINTSKGNDVCREQQLVKHNKRTKRILVVDDEYDTNLTLKVVLEESDFKVNSYTAAENTYYETFRKHAYPNYDDSCILRKPIENKLLIKQIMSIIG